MFNDRPSHDIPQGGKRVSYQKKPDTFSIGWAVEETNQNNRKKDRDVQIKLNTPTTQITSKPQREVPREESSYRQPPPQKKQAPLGYTEEQVFDSLKRYEKLEDMPQDELDKVLLYYDNMKNEPQHREQEHQYRQPVQTQPTYQQQYQQQGYQPRYQQQYQRAPSSANSIPIETREPIRPKDNIKGVINNEPISQSIPTNTRYSQKNKTTLTLGDGYNPFIQQAPKNTKKTQFQRIQQNSKKPTNQGYKISNIFG